MSKVAKNWSYTLNNYTPADVNTAKALDCKFHVIGFEVGENGTRHLQGNIIFATAKRLTGLQGFFNKRAHWEVTKCPESASNYCRKAGEFWEVDHRAQGKRTDIDSAIETLKTNGLQRLVEDHPREYIKYHSGLEKLSFRLSAKRDFKPTVTWIYGPTGTGKTRQVVEGEKDLWISGKSLRWWDGYENQEAVLFDDFRKDFCTFHELLRILDRYPYSVEVKGGHRELNSRRMYITSCYPPTEVYHTREDVSQLLRRIDHIIETKQVTEVNLD